VTRVRSGQFFVARVGLGQPFMVWVWIWKISPKSVNFLPSGQKNLFRSGQKVPGSKAGRPLIYCGSKVSSGRAGSGPISNKNPVMTFPIEKRINTLTRIKNMNNEGDQPVGTSWFKERVYLVQKCYFELKGAGMKDQMSTYLEISFSGMWQK